MNAPDGRVRSTDVEKKLNLLAVSTFGTGPGREFLDYLKSITTNVAIAGPGLDVNALLHLEGQRYLIGLIQTRIELGHKENRNGQGPDPR